jgi:hypothetical protein
MKQSYKYASAALLSMGVLSYLATPRAETPPPFEVSASDMYTQYHANEVRADGLYNGRDVLVTGAVKSIGTDLFSSKALVRLETPNRFLSVSARGGYKFTDGAALLNEGDQVTLACKGAGLSVGMPHLVNCSIQ